jgi:hypothetical protein
MMKSSSKGPAYAVVVKHPEVILHRLGMLGVMCDCRVEVNALAISRRGCEARNTQSSSIGLFGLFLFQYQRLQIGPEPHLLPES